MTQTIDSTHYEMIETDRQGNKAYINVDIKKYVGCILNHKYMCTIYDKYNSIVTIAVIINDHM